MTDTETKWRRVEILSVTIAGYFRSAAATDFDFVPTISEQPAITLELVDDAGNREMAGIFFGDTLPDARRGAANVAAETGVPVLDYTHNDARKAQQ